MTFTPEQVKALSAPLDPRHVKPAPQGKYGEYIEGWHAIAEANRIFGFGGWSSKTELEQLGEPVEINGKWRVNYRAVCTITVGDVVRQGCGFGQGIDRDIGQAHESALKEAETDSRKRAFMTFGNPFGLALYDKTKANVQSPPKEMPTGPINDKTRDWLQAQIDSTDKPIGEFCHAFDVQSLKDITYEDMDAVRKWIAEQKEG